MTILFTILHVIVCLFLILVVLAQQGKGQDLASAFGGAGSQTAFGARGTATLLSKITAGAAILFMVTSLMLSYLRPVTGPRTVVPETAPASAPATQPEGGSTPATPPAEESTTPSAAAGVRGPRPRGNGSRSRHDPGARKAAAVDDERTVPAGTEEVDRFSSCLAVGPRRLYNVRSFGPVGSRSTHPSCRSGGIGRHARLRGVWGDPWGFESPLRHQTSSCRLESTTTQRSRKRLTSVKMVRMDPE